MTAEKKVILIVDDEDSIHKALTRTLRQEPYELLHAFDASEANVILGQRSNIAAIVCDHFMPGTSGLALLMDVRTRFPSMATMLLTAQADLNLVLAAINDGRIHCFLTKPWNSHELRSRLAELVGRKGPAEGARAAALQRIHAELQTGTVPERDPRTGAYVIDPS